MVSDRFDSYVEKYDMWYESNEAAYASELAAVRELIPEFVPGKSLEIGVGTGRFAAPLGVRYGIDPSVKMLERAGQRGVETLRGIAEKLPFRDSSFEMVLMVTALCFTEVGPSLKEVSRVLNDGGQLIVGFIDRDSPLAIEYRSRAAQSTFYGNARFFSPEGLMSMLDRHGFRDIVFRQTLFRPLSEIGSPEKPLQGFGKGSFVVVKATNIKDRYPISSYNLYGVAG